MTQNKDNPSRSSTSPTGEVVLSESEFREGAQVVSTKMADGYTPPSASMNAAASASSDTTTSPVTGSSSTGQSASNAE